MEFSNRLFFGTEAEKRQKELLHKLKRKKWESGIFVITISKNEYDIFDIYETTQFKMPSLRKIEPKVVGIAASKEEAMELVRTIIEAIYNEKQITGTAIKNLF